MMVGVLMAGMLKGDVVHKLPDTFIRNLRSVQGGISQAVSIFIQIHDMFRTDLCESFSDDQSPDYARRLGSLSRCRACSSSRVFDEPFL